MLARSIRREIVPLALPALAVAVACGVFFGRYAFDDSYVGYSVTKSLLAGAGFSFNGGDRVLSTSAPLAPLLYYPLALVLRGDVVLAAQIFSALALAVVAFGSYAVARRVSTPNGAALGAITFTCSPFVLLLWSHETLLCTAACTAGLALYAYGRRPWAAAVLGLAVLLRGEALLLLPFLWYNEYRAQRNTVWFAAATLVPFVIWSAFALPYFGSIFSATVASKHAQLLYPQITPYLDGLRDYVTRMYALTPSVLWVRSIALLCVICIACAAMCRLITRVYLGIALWVAVATVVYVALGLPFYFWFCAQLGAGMAALVVMLWPKVRPQEYAMLQWAGRAAAIALTGINAGFLALQVVQPDRMMTSYDWIVMPRIAGNTYRSLGNHFAHAPFAARTVAYPEMGELHYYSNVPIVDYLGIVTPGAAAALERDDAIWTYKRYHPAAVIVTGNFSYFLDPLEYDWFLRAYSVGTQNGRPEILDLPGDPTREFFTVYRLRKATAIPAPDVAVESFGDRLPFAYRDGVGVEFGVPAQPSEVELRLRVPRSCTRFVLTLHDGRLRKAVRRSLQHGEFVRFTIAAGELREPGPYTFNVRGCRGMSLAPAPRLRTWPVVFGKPPGEPAQPTDALRVYLPQAAEETANR